MQIVLRKPEWPNKVFHPARVRRGVAVLLARRRKNPVKRPPGVKRRIPVAEPLAPPALQEAA